MAKFSAEQCRILADMVRIDLRYMRENVALRMILMSAVHNGDCLHNRQQSLDDLLSGPVLSALGNDIQEWITRLDQAADEIDVAELLKKLPEDGRTY